MNYEEWWSHITGRLEFTEGGPEHLKEDIRVLVESWLKAIGRRPTPWEQVHPFNVFRVINKLLEENACVQVLAHMVAHGANVLLDRVPHRVADGYPPDMPNLGPSLSMETHQQQFSGL